MSTKFVTGFRDIAKKERDIIEVAKLVVTRYHEAKALWRDMAQPHQGVIRILKGGSL